MSMSDCAKCWDTPCTCGYEYKDYTPVQLALLISGMLRYHSRDEADDILKIATEQIKHSKDWIEK